MWLHASLRNCNHTQIRQYHALYRKIAGLYYILFFYQYKLLTQNISLQSSLKHLVFQGLYFGQKLTRLARQVTSYIASQLASGLEGRKHQQQKFLSHLFRGHIHTHTAMKNVNLMLFQTHSSSPLVFVLTKKPDHIHILPALT